MNKILLHFVLMGGSMAGLFGAMVYPFLLGTYDPLAMGLSTMVQVFGMVGLVLVPIGLVWAGYEGWKAGRVRQNIPTPSQSHRLARVSLVVGALVAVVLCIVAVATVGMALGFLTLTGTLYVATRAIHAIRRMRNGHRTTFNVVPLYLIVLPIAVLIVQLLVATPITQSSRARAIDTSAELLTDIETYREANGRYPDSLSAVWQDYAPAIVGIARYHYVPQGAAFNLYFEQPRFLLDNIGAREFVVYNPLDEQTMISHDSWILIFSPDALMENQGWYEVHEAGVPHWKYFWFD